MATFGPIGDPRDCSGDWSGHYHHASPSDADRAFPIHATLAQVGERLEGTMSDEVTGSAYSVRKLFEDGRDRMGWLHRHIVGEMLRKHPEAIVESSLPADSVIRGRVRGEVVRFTKTYAGPNAIRFRDPGATFASVDRRGDHRVHYRGLFDGGRGVIEGTWSIRRLGLFGRFRRPLATGTFTLSRRG